MRRKEGRGLNEREGVDDGREGGENWTKGGLFLRDVREEKGWGELENRRIVFKRLRSGCAQV